MKTTFILAGTGLAVLMGSIFFLTDKNRQENSDKQNNPEQVQDSNDEIKTGFSVSENAASGSPTLKLKGYSPGTFSAYSPGIISRLDGKKIILMFSSSDCQSCVDLRTDISKNLARIPSDVAILEADINLDTALAEQYEITEPLNFVQISSGGDRITMWQGSTSFAELNQLIK